jgi:hypothetical protein
MDCINDQTNPVVKFLGVYIDPNLNFKEHLNKIGQKVSTGLFYLRKVRNILNKKALKYLYNSLVHSHLTYANHIWSSIPESNLKPLFLKQKQAIRIISDSKYNAHTKPLFKSLRILPLPDLCLFFKIQFMQQFVQDLLPSSFANTWITNRIRRADQPQVTLRNEDDLHIPPARTKATSLLPLTNFPKLWSEFPEEEIKFQRNKIIFNTQLKEHFLSKLNFVPNCTRMLLSKLPQLSRSSSKLIVNSQDLI